MASYIILFIILAFIILVIFKRPLKPISNWQHSFVGQQFSSQDIYKRIEQAIKKRDIPDVELSRTYYHHGGLFTSSREYLRVSRNEYLFDICAAPFGKDFFVSWWLVERNPGLLARIPLLNTLLGENPKYKSYYQTDTEAMFRGSIHGCVLDVIDDITKDSGIRLSESDRMVRERIS